MWIDAILAAGAMSGGVGLVVSDKGVGRDGISAGTGTVLLIGGFVLAMSALAGHSRVIRCRAAIEASS